MYHRSYRSIKPFHYYFKRTNRSVGSVGMKEIERQVHEVLHNVNWLLESHNSFAELIQIKGKKVIIRCVGHCADCESDCVRVAFRERMPNINLVLQ